MAKKKKKRKLTPFGRFLKISYRILMTLSLLIVVGYAAWNLAVRPPAITPPPAPPSLGAADNPDTPDVDESLTSSGTDSARKPLFYTFLLIAKDQVSSSTDTIIAASYDVTNQRASLVSIPRDTLVDRRVGPYHYYKINAAYANGGLDELKSAVGDLLGIPIDFHVVVDVDSFVKIVDAAGGIDFEVPVRMRYQDPLQGLRISYDAQMYYGLTGQKVLEIARCRKNSDGDPKVNDGIYDAYPDAEIGRTRTQQALLKAIAKKLISWNSVPKLTAFLEIFNQSVETNLSLTDMLYFAPSAMGVDMATDLITTTFPGDGSVTYQGHTWCYQCDLPAALEIINTMLNPYTAPITADMTDILQVS